MKRLKVITVDSDAITFENGVTLCSYHEDDCCENHWLGFADLEIKDFEGLQFDLTNDEFFKRIPGYGIELIPIHGHSVRIAGYGSNNGYYSSNLSLVLSNLGGKDRIFDITECQDRENF
ncbi:MAG: hypothetical protein IPP69_15905 [Flavobacteriales bacterium]|nr:hypothetical protein [Flavobacteriales bacterium]